MSIDLAWLPELPEWTGLLEAARHEGVEEAFAAFERLANSRMDFVRAGKLDKAVQRYLAAMHEAKLPLPVIKLALLGSSTLSHLLPGIRLGGLRRGFLLDIYVGPYGLYRQELANPGSGLYEFKPDVVCFAFDAQHLAGGENASVEGAMANVHQCWQLAKENLGCRAVIQQTLLPRFPVLLGNNENRLRTSPAAVVQQVNQEMRAAAAGEGVNLLSVDMWSAEDGLSQWFDASLWYQAKQEVHPRAAVIYGDQIGRLIGALWGRSSKCLVLDLDNTLWGGVIGDDGLEGIVLGQGSPAGEAYVAFQRYAKQLSERGVILAVCSKNDEANALEPFEKHPEMVLRRKDIACYVANWTDKATNIRAIAERLNIGLDSLVFADDNPAERRLVRSELPMVAVPELPEDPAEYARTIADAGYFEAVDLTEEDRERTELYRANAAREAARSSATDIGAFLDGLQMELFANGFDMPGLKRIVQLINKTNQFNLTTTRYTEADVLRMMADENTATLQLRLTDVHGDNGVIGLCVGFRRGEDLAINTWLMSCRVLGRGVEEATLNLLVERALEMGCTRLLGSYKPSAKNGMVREHYPKLGFAPLGEPREGETFWQLSLADFEPRPTHMKVVKGEAWTQPASIGR
jgi:FkbH-like protein